MAVGEGVGEGTAVSVGAVVGQGVNEAVTGGAAVGEALGVGGRVMGTAVAAKVGADMVRSTDTALPPPTQAAKTRISKLQNPATTYDILHFPLKNPNIAPIVHRPHSLVNLLDKPAEIFYPVHTYTKQEVV